MTDLPANASSNLTAFQTVCQLIQEAKNRAMRQANSIVIQLYWDIGAYIVTQTKELGWGRGVVNELAEYLKVKEPSQKGYSARNLWRMKQFYETYVDEPKLSALLTEISWTNHLHILSKTKSPEERNYYLELASKYPYPERELARMIESGTYERTHLADQKLSAALTVLPAAPQGVFKDSYVFEFLALAPDHKEADLKHALLANLKKFLLELGTDFSFIGEEYPIQVGMRDFRIDLLMYHRGLNCLAAIELKVTEFEPEHLGKLQFYLEALDKDVKKPQENPSIGILICKTKDDEVVKYALNRNASPAMIAEYETQLIDKQVLRNKLHQLSLALTDATETASYD